MSLRLLLCFGTFLFCHSLVFAQPGNDNPCNAISIALDAAPLANDITGAGVDAGEPVPPSAAAPADCFISWCNGDPDAQNTVWYTFTAPPSGAVIVNTCLEGTAFDTQIAIWSAGECSDFSGFDFIAANDDIAGGCTDGAQYASQLFCDGLDAGLIYYIQVDGYDGEADSLYIEVQSALPSSQVNFIHNCADLALETVDIRINGELFFDNMNFRTCTGFQDLDAGSELYLTINPAESTDDLNPYWSDSITLDPLKNYLACLTGIWSATGYTPAPSLELVFMEDALIGTTQAGVIPVIFHHGVSDLPALDLLNLESSAVINNDLFTGAFSQEGYSQLNPENFSLQVSDEDGNDLGMNYCLEIAQGVDFGAAFTLAFSGFYNPANNSGGAPLGLFVVNHFDGSFIELDPGACAFPGNDDICNAQELIVNDPPFAADNSLASVQDGESMPVNLPGSDPESNCINQWCDGTLENTLWFNFVAPVSGTVVITTCFDPGIDTQVAVCTVDNCADFSTVTYFLQNDDMEGGCNSGDTYASYLLQDGLIPGETYFIHLDGWQGSAGPFSIQVTSVDVSTAETGFNRTAIFPNPANDFFTVKTEGQAELSLYDLSGRLLMRTKTSGNSRIDCSSLAPGIYLAEILHAGIRENHKITVE